MKLKIVGKFKKNQNIMLQLGMRVVWAGKRNVDKIFLPDA